ncbi:MAG: hypothetical protein IPO21_03675 [Bacteroidales bacterium]|nr:hypothetical protein [Bacteroidales bacterium]
MAKNFKTRGFYDLGVNFYGKTKFLKYNFMIANTDGALPFNDIATSKSKNANDVSGLKELLRIAVTPIEKLEIGLFAGISNYKQTATLTDQLTTRYLGIDGSLRAKPTRIDFGFISGTYGNITADTIETAPTVTKYNGLYYHQMINIKDRIQPTFGFDYYVGNTYLADDNTFMIATVGVDIILGKGFKLQANYLNRIEKTNYIKNDMLLFNLQYVFNKKEM